MPATEPLATRTRREGLRVGWIMLFAALSLVPIAVWNHAREPRTAVEVVTAFMEAVRDKDLDRAYGFVGASVPAGPGAAFLHPDAIGDWELLAVEQVDGDDRTASVRVVVGTGAGTAEGRFTVVERDGRRVLEDPFQTVTVAASSYLFVQVNDRVVPVPPRTTWNDWQAEQALRRIELLPGVYRFYGGEPVALLGDQDDAAAIGVPLPDLAADALQRAVNEHLDACVEYRRAAPPGCPFATDGSVDTVDRARLTQVRGLEWTIEEYPVATAATGSGWWDEPVLVVAFTDPGRLTLRGEGTAAGDAWETFTADCRFGGEQLRVLADADGSLQVAPLGPETEDTCRGTQGEEV